MTALWDKIGRHIIAMTTQQACLLHQAIQQKVRTPMGHVHETAD